MSGLKIFKEQKKKYILSGCIRMTKSLKQKLISEEEKQLRHLHKVKLPEICKIVNCDRPHYHLLVSGFLNSSNYFIF